MYMDEAGINISFHRVSRMLGKLAIDLNIYKEM